MHCDICGFSETFAGWTSELLADMTYVPRSQTWKCRMGKDILAVTMVRLGWFLHPVDISTFAVTSLLRVCFYPRFGRAKASIDLI